MRAIGARTSRVFMDIIICGDNLLAMASGCGWRCVVSGDVSWVLIFC